MIVTADVHTLLADPTNRHGQAGVPPATVDTGEPGGTDISPVAAQSLFCDAEAVPAVLDGHGRALDVGESVYRFPARIRRAIEIRDRHCTFPACSAPPAWCHAHHLVPFGRHGRPGGPTAEANGTLLCGRHHPWSTGTSTGPHPNPAHHPVKRKTTSDSSKPDSGSSPSAGSPATHS